MTLAIGTRLGPYEVLSQLGKGGMGEVYRARDTKLNREVALKVLPEAFASDAERLVRFHREAQVLASLNHPHIAQIHGLEDTEVRAIVMELVEGPTLADRIAHSPIPLAEARTIGTQIAEALEAAHEKGIVHRDLKPANIKLRGDGAVVKVLDFGLAAVVRLPEPQPNDAANTPTVRLTVTQTGLILGTPAYMSPEQARGQPVDKRADIWAFGAVLFEMLSGQQAYGGTSTTDILVGIVSREPDWSLLPADTPPAVRQLLARCLEKDPHRRLRDIGEARVILSDNSKATTSVAQPVTIPSVAATRHSRARILLLASLVLLGIATVVSVKLFRRQGNIQPPAAAQGAGPFRLVVFPFENLSRQPGDEWLAGAFSDSLTVGLQDVENVVLINRERLQDLNLSGTSDPQQIARSLGVRYYVNGTLQRVGDDLKVVARLVDADAGTIAHQEPITDRFTNLFQIEDKLSRRFAAALQLSPVASRHPQPPSVEAYRAVAQANDLYLKGRFAEAVDKLESTIAEDERYAEAWALLGKSYAQRSAPNNLDRSTRGEFLERALRASRRAIELDSNLYEAYIALASTYQQLEQEDNWRSAAQQAIDLNPRLAEGYVLLGDSYAASPAFGCARKRDPDLAVSVYQKAVDLTPSFGAARARLSTNLVWSRREADALRETENAVKLLPENVLIQRTRAGALLWSGRTEELEQQTRKVATLGSPTILDKWMLAVLSLLQGHTEEAALQFKEVVKSGPALIREMDTGRIYAQVGHMTEAADHLEHAFALDPSCAAFVSWSPAFMSYRSDPALRGLLSKYPQATAPAIK